MRTMQRSQQLQRAFQVPTGSNCSGNALHLTHFQKCIEDLIECRTRGRSHSDRFSAASASSLAIWTYRSSVKKRSRSEALCRRALAPLSLKESMVDAPGHF